MYHLAFNSERRKIYKSIVAWYGAAFLLNLTLVREIGEAGLELPSSNRIVEQFLNVDAPSEVSLWRSCACKMTAPSSL